MASIRPFRALRYGTDHRDDLDALISPPSVGTRPTDRDSTAGLHELNILQVVRGRNHPKDPDAPPYAWAADLLARWRRDAVLTRDPTAGFYLLEQRLPGDGDRRLRSVVGLLHLDDGGPGALPHEGVENEDRIEDIITALDRTRIQASMVMVLVPDDDGRWSDWMDRRDPGKGLYARSGDGILCRFAGIHDDEASAELIALAAEKTLVIADGHHRYEASRRHRERVRERDRLRPGDKHPVDFILVQLMRVQEAELRVAGAGSPAEVWEAAVDGRTFPPKATRFSPKAPKGLVLHPLSRF